ncbi:hypothetical protein [Roseivirga sp. E12]|uniref:hypothetical protein n=1 Tax=Roseivirga sp. E12 TaxID=2819237 RepID=UPI001ABCB2D5|nr:hypothetical protein [Roseivirga sp. E12]MBO3697551.1 hypothetical protein [Roseivirga sp. E12]
MSRLFALLLLAVFPVALQGQEATDKPYREDWGKFDHLDLAVGFNRNPSPTTESVAYHSLEVSLWQSVNFRYNHPASSTFYISQELGLASNKVIHGSKAGLWLGFWGFILGGEAKYLTDYQDQTFILSPFMGFGNYPFRFTIGYSGRISGSGSLRDISKVSMNLSIAILPLRKSKKID